MNPNKGMSTSEINEEDQDHLMDMAFALREAAVKGRWNQVIEMYKTYKRARTVEVNITRGTALHNAVNDGKEDVVKRLVEAIIKHESAHEQEEDDDDKVNALELKNEQGDTPLHLAASRGFKGMCECIIGENQEMKHLILVGNNRGETPLFLAALTWQKKAFAYLSHVSQYDIKLRDLIRDDGETILHCAIRYEFFDLALIIMGRFPQLHDVQNEQGFTPLDVLATKPFAFPSGTKLPWWKQIMYHCITVEELDVKKAWNSCLEKKDESEKNGKVPANYATCHQFVKLACLKTLGFLGVGKTNELEDPEASNVSEEENKRKYTSTVPANYATCHQFVKLACLRTLSVLGGGVNVVKDMKQKHKFVDQLLCEFMKTLNESNMGSGRQPIQREYDLDEIKPFSAYVNNKKEDTEDEYKEAQEINKKETALLTAARYGIVEMVTLIIYEMPRALHDTTSDKKNVFLVAVDNRQSLVIEALLRLLSMEDTKNLIQAEDNEENTVLHLAAEATIFDTDLKIAESTFQMMWAAKWYQYIKLLVPAHFNFRNNKNGKKPKEIFDESHQKLLKESSKWLNHCSSAVVSSACGIAFAISSNAPGGTKEDTGKPALKGKLEFDSTMILLVGLLLSLTALVAFLSILTSRKQAKYFLRDLPLKLLFGLGCLYMSIVAIFGSFSLAHYILPGDGDKDERFIYRFYVSICWLVILWPLKELPLYFGLVSTIRAEIPPPLYRGDDS